jgi:protein-tyrosine phosphatase
MYWIEGPWPGKLGILARPRGADWLPDEIAGWKETGVHVVVSLLTQSETSELGLTDESELVQERGLTFITFPISDYSVPGSRERTEELIAKLEDLLTQGHSVGIHCRAGIGRSSLVAACVLVNSGESPQDAFEQITIARGCRVPDTSEQRDWVSGFARDLRQDCRVWQD